MDRMPGPTLVMPPGPEIIVPGVPVWMMTTFVSMLHERMPPLVVTVIVMAEETNEGPLLVVTVFSIVPPSNTIVAPELAVIWPDRGMDNLAPLFIVIVPVPSAVAAPTSDTVPSLFVIPPMVMPDGEVIVNAAVASVPAEKTAMSPEANVVVAEHPVGSVVQSVPEVFQVPRPVPCPEPQVAPLMSQYLIAA